MRVLMGLVIGLTTVAGSAQAQWKITGMGNNAYSAVNSSNISTTGQLKRAWVVIVPRSGEPGAYMLGRFTFDCQQGTRSQTDWLVYNAIGSPISQNRETTPYISVMPDTIFESDYLAVCENRWDATPSFESASDVYGWASDYFDVMDSISQ